MQNAPLSGLLVVETAAVLAGPAVGMFFAELGAQVIKLENKRSGGDVTRSWKLPSEDLSATVSAYFSSVNHGKEHRQVDLRSAEDRAEFDALIAKADVLISNHLAEDAEKLGLSRARLRQLNHKLIHGHIKGFADQPARPAYDVVLQAETGYISMTGTDADHLAKLPVAMIDVLAAHQLKEGLLLALLQRATTGKGAYVEVSLEESAIAGLVNQASNYLMASHVPTPIGTLHPNIAPYGEVFRCADGGRIILAVGSDVQFRALCAVLELNALPLDPRFAHNPQRVVNRIELALSLETAIAGQGRSVLLQKLIDAGVPAGAVLRVDEVLDTPAARAMIIDERINGVDTRRVRGNVFRIHSE